MIVFSFFTDSGCKRIFKNQTSSTGDIPFYKIGTFGKNANSFISKEIFKDFKSKYSFPKKGEILLSASGTIGRAVIYNGEDAYYQDSNIVWIENNEKKVLNKFLFYCYQNIKWEKYYSKGGTIARLYNDDLRKIPIPPLSVQKAVVEILDRFESLQSNLNSELDLRQKQNEYYREKLLGFERV